MNLGTCPAPRTRTDHAARSSGTAWCAPCHGGVGHRRARTIHPLRGGRRTAYRSASACGACASSTASCSSGTAQDEPPTWEIDDIFTSTPDLHRPRRLLRGVARDVRPLRRRAGAPAAAAENRHGAALPVRTPRDGAPGPRVLERRGPVLQFEAGWPNVKSDDPNDMSPARLPRNHNGLGVRSPRSAGAQNHRLVFSSTPIRQQDNNMLSSPSGRRASRATTRAPPRRCARRCGGSSSTSMEDDLEIWRYHRTTSVTPVMAKGDAKIRPAAEVGRRPVASSVSTPRCPSASIPDAPLMASMREAIGRCRRRRPHRWNCGRWPTSVSACSPSRCRRWRGSASGRSRSRRPTAPSCLQCGARKERAQPAARGAVPARGRDGVRQRRGLSARSCAATWSAAVCRCTRLRPARTPEHPAPSPSRTARGAGVAAPRTGDSVSTPPHAVIGVDPARIAVMGDGRAAASPAGVALHRPDRGVPLREQILVFPMLDDRTTVPDPELVDFAGGPPAERDGLAGVARRRHRRPDVSPYAAPSGPPIFSRAWRLYTLDVGALDIFRDEDVDVLPAHSVPRGCRWSCTCTRGSPTAST